MTWDEARHKIKADYEAVLGRVILVHELTGYKDDHMHDFYLALPAKVKVVSTLETDLFHCVDNEWIDPYWNLELVEPDPQLEGYASLWMFGTSYNVASNESALARFWELGKEVAQP